MVIEPRFDAAHDFSEGLAAVRVGQKWGYIDRTGEFAIEPRFRKEKGDDSWGPPVAAFSEGLARVRVGKQHGYIDRTGQFAIEPKFKACYRFSDGLAPAMIADYRSVDDRFNYGYIDRMGEFVIAPRFKRCRPFSEGLANVSVGEKVFDKDRPGSFFIRTKAGYIDKTGAFVIEPRFMSAGSFSEGLALARERVGLYGYIDRTGTFVIEPQFGSGSHAFSGGLAHVILGGKGARYTEHCYVDKTGKFIWPITSPRRGAVLLEGFKGDAWSTDWWLRFRVLNPDGELLPGVQVWMPDRAQGQVMSQSLPIPWWDIGKRGTGTARAKWINHTNASEFVSGADGVVKMGPFRGPVGGGGTLYHPDHATRRVAADPEKHSPDANRVVDLGDVTLPRGNTVSGVVTRPDGMPVREAWVAAQPFREEDPDRPTRRRSLHELRPSRRGDTHGPHGRPGPLQASGARARPLRRGSVERILPAVDGGRRLLAGAPAGGRASNTDRQFRAQGGGNDHGPRTRR